MTVEQLIEALNNGLANGDFDRDTEVGGGIQQYYTGDQAGNLKHHWGCYHTTHLEVEKNNIISYEPNGKRVHHGFKKVVMIS